MVTFRLIFSFVLLMSLYGYSAFAAKQIPGVIQNSPPLLPMDQSIKPNLQGNIDNTGQALTSGSGDSLLEERELDEEGFSDSLVGNDSSKTKNTLSIEGGSNGVWIIIISIIIIVGLGLVFMRRKNNAQIN